MTTKKKYEKPALQVYELKHQPQLLAGSKNASSNVDDLSDYKDGGNPFSN